MAWLSRDVSLAEVGEGASADGDGLLLSFTTGGPGPNGLPGGGVARIDGRGQLDFRLDGFAFPHDIIRDPVDRSLLVVETSADRLKWVDARADSTEPLRVVAAKQADLPRLPNGAERLDYKGRSLLLVSHRGSIKAEPTREIGSLTLWDITVPTDPQRLWRFPAEGGLDMPHGPILRQVKGDWWLIYAHTGGAGAEGSIGLAVAKDPLTLPTYVADLVPQFEPLGFVRGVELTASGRLFITDSGTLGGGEAGRVFEADWPDLEPVGDQLGRLGDQRFEFLSNEHLLLGGLSSPFEGWLWTAGSEPG